MLSRLHTDVAQSSNNQLALNNGQHAEQPTTIINNYVTQFIYSQVPEELQNNIQSLRMSMVGLTEKMEELQVSNDEIKTVVNQLKISMVNEAKEYQRRIDRLEEKLQNSRNEMNKHAKENKECVAKLKRQIENLRNENANQVLGNQRHINTLKEELQKVKDEMRNQATDYEDHIKKLEKQLEENRKKLTVEGWGTEQIISWFMGLSIFKRCVVIILVLVVAGCCVQAAYWAIPHIVNFVRKASELYATKFLPAVSKMNFNGKYANGFVEVLKGSRSLLEFAKGIDKSQVAFFAKDVVISTALTGLAGSLAVPLLQMI